MKKFLLKVCWIIATLFILMGLLDLAFTHAYTNTPPRNKTRYLVQLRNRHIDYIFLGSSRVRDLINTKIVVSKTSKTAINLGINGTKPDDIFLQLKLLVDNKVTFTKIFIQIDYTYNAVDPSNLVGSEALPYIRNNAVVRAHLRQFEPNFIPYYYVPFYRYIDNAHTIGFRSFFSTVVSRDKLDFTDGFEPWGDKFSKGTFRLPNKITASNTTFDAIQKFCIDHKIDVVYFTSPYCDDFLNNSFTDQLKLKVPQLNDYSKALTNKKYFRDCLHLNLTGADVFTKMLVEDCITNP